MTEKKTFVDRIIDKALELGSTIKTKDPLFEEKAEKMRALGYKTVQDWTDRFIAEGFHKTPAVADQFLGGIFRAIIGDIITNMDEQITVEAMLQKVDENPDLKGN